MEQLPKKFFFLSLLLFLFFKKKNHSGTVNTEIDELNGNK